MSKFVIPLSSLLSLLSLFNFSLSHSHSCCLSFIHSFTHAFLNAAYLHLFLLVIFTPWPFMHKQAISLFLSPDFSLILSSPLSLSVFPLFTSHTNINHNKFFFSHHPSLLPLSSKIASCSLLSSFLLSSFLPRSVRPCLPSQDALPSVNS